MTLNNDDYILIEKFFDNDLSKEELEKFNQRLKEDSEFEKELKFREAIQDQLKKANEYKRVKSNVSTILSKKQSFLRDNITYLALAASVIILVGIYILIDSNIFKSENNQFADQLNSDSISNNQNVGFDTINQQSNIEEDQIANVDIADSKPTEQIANNESTPTLDEKEMLELKKREKISNLVASNYTTPKFEYTLLRSQTSDATDLFINAADNYKEQDYDSCILILNDLLTKKYFNNPDTISEMHYFLGHCYLATGIAKKDNTLIESSIASFEKVEVIYFIKEAKWYSVLAYFELGKNEKGSQLIEELIPTNYPENIKEFRDSMMIFLRN